jgi:hypothetical protein
VAARERESWCEARRLCRSKDRGFPQGFSKEIQEATQDKTLSAPSLGHDLAIGRFIECALD